MTNDDEEVRELPDLSPIRRRPGMYVGDLGERGLLYMLQGVIDNAFHEQLDGSATYCRVTLEGPTVTVEDDGAGIAAAPSPDSGGITALERSLTRLSLGSHHGGQRPSRWHHPLHRCELAIVNALSSRFEVEVHRDGRRHQACFERGERTGPLRDLGPTGRTGTRVRFTPDAEIFETVTWNRAAIAGYLRERAALGSGLVAVLDDQVFRSPDGLADLARHLAAGAPLHVPVRVRGSYRRRPDPNTANPADPDAELAAIIEIDGTLLWTDRPDIAIHGFVNGHAFERGNHIGAIRAGIRGAVRSVAPDLVAAASPTAFHEAMLPGLVAIVHIITLRPQWAPRLSRWFLADRGVRAALRALTTTALSRALADDLALRRALLTRLP